MSPAATSAECRHGTVAVPEYDERARRAVHAVEDVLLAAAVVAFASERRIPLDVFEDMIRLLAEARQKGRAHEMVAAAHRQAADLQEWTCSACGESNPGTFELCWNCSTDADSPSRGLSAESEALLALDAGLRFQKENRLSLQDGDDGRR